jgi:serine/threonine protein kinase
VANTINQHLDDMVGRLALNRGLVNPEDLMAALSEQAVAGVSPEGTPKPYRALSEILIEKGYLTESQRASLLKEIEARLAPTIAEGGGVGGALADTAQTRLGKYTLVRELGRGGMGCVFEAFDTELGRKVALKLMYARPHLDASEVTPEEERFLQEARLTARVPKHPGIVSLHEAGIIEGRRYISMEFIDGVSMLEWRQKPNITLRQKILLLRDVALAVHHAHEHGVVHRDLKPQNVLVTAEEQPYVTDFGLAKAMGPSKSVSLTASGMTVGTPTYMSPEQAQGLKSLDRRADVYSLGVMLYETLAGRPPFAGESAIEILMKAVKHHLPRPSSVLDAVTDPALDETIENICLKAMARVPRDRYPTAKAFADDLTLWLDGKPVNVRAPRPSPFTESNPSYRWLFAAIVAGVLGLIVPKAMPLLFPPGQPLEALTRAELMMKQQRYRDALLEYAKVLAVDPRNLRADVGRRLALERMEDQAERERQEIASARAAAEAAAREAEAAQQTYLEREAELRREAEASRVAAGKARQEAEAAARAEIESMRQAEAVEDAAQKAVQDRLAAERSAAEARALAAEEKARNSQELLAQAREQARIAAERPAGPPPLVLPGRDPLKAAAVDRTRLRPGLVAECYTGTDFNALALRRVDPQVNFRWLRGPAWEGGAVDNFSIRWSGYLLVPRTDRYQFEAFSDDGVRLFIDDAVILADWTSHFRLKTSGGCYLEEGLHRVRLEYFEGREDALVTLSWILGNTWEAEPIGPEQFLHDPAALEAKPGAGKPR